MGSFRSLTPVPDPMPIGARPTSEVPGKVFKFLEGQGKKTFKFLKDNTHLGENIREVDRVVKDPVGSAVAAGGAVTRAAIKATQPIIDKVLPVNAAKFLEFSANDGYVNLNKEAFTKKDLAYLRERASDAINNNDGEFTYPTWGYENKSILMRSLPNATKQSFKDPGFRMATLIGRTSPGEVYINDEGHIIIEDTYDFNSGKRGELYKEALDAKESGDQKQWKALRAEALNGLTGFEQLRVLAFAELGGGAPGTKLKLDLGPAGDGK